MMKINSNEILSLDDIFKFPHLLFNYGGNFSQSSLFSHLHNSFNECLSNDIPLYLEKVKHVIYETINDENKMIKYFLSFKNVQIKHPMMDSDSEIMLPKDARDRNLTYSAKIIASVTQIQEITDLNTMQKQTNIIYSNDKTLIGIIPIMVKSKYCNITITKNNESECDYDPGGYFIVNGMEKVVISIERMCENKPLVFVKKESNLTTYTVQVNSKSYEINGMTQIVTLRLKKNNILTLIVSMLHEVSIFVVLRALGMETDMEIINNIVHDRNDTDMINLAIILLENSKTKNKILNQEDALNFLIGKLKINVKYNETDKNIKQQQKKMYLIDSLENNFLPHIKSNECISSGKMIYKAHYICYMIYRLLNVVLERKIPDDRDSFVNKRIDTVGNFIDDIFRQQFKKMIGDCHKYFKDKNTDDKNPINIINKLNPNTVLQGIRTSLSLGNWGKKQGVAQMLMRLTYLQPISFLRRVDAPNIDKQKIKSTAPRHYNPSQNGFLSACETQEHAKVGLIKNLSLLGSITIMKYSQIRIIKKLLREYLVDILDTSREERFEYGKVFINGDWIGLTKEIVTVGTMFKKYKFDGTLDKNVGITIDIQNNELKFYCDGGRLYRPVFRVVDNVVQVKKQDVDDISLNKNEHTKITSWNQLMVEKPYIFEYLDIEESHFSIIAPCINDVHDMHDIMINSIKKKPDEGIIINRYDDSVFKTYTHCEIHPSLLEGLLASNIPFMNRNDAPRNIFQYAQGKQAISLYSSNYRDRMDSCYILRHPQKALVSTRAGKFTHTNTLPCGENIIVAISVYNGHNQEDAIIINEAAIQRGLFSVTYYRKYDSTIRKNQITSQNDIFMKPDFEQVSGMRYGVYDKLNEKGYVPEETTVVNGDVIIGKVTPLLPTEGNNKKYKDCSANYKFIEPGVVDRVQTDIFNSEGYEIKKMSVRSERNPRIGDKFCLLDTADVLTNNGWKSIAKITKDDLVATLDNNKYLKYVHPIDIMSFDYNGEMYKLRSKFVNLDVTIDHKLYVKTNDNNFDLITAREAYGTNVKHKKNCTNNYSDKKTFVINDEIFDMDLFLDLLGLFIVNGYVYENYITFNFSKENNINLIHLKNICDKLNIDVVLLKSKYNGYQYCIDNKNLVYFFINLYLEWNQNILSKYNVQNSKLLHLFLPNFVWNLSQRQSRILLSSMIHGFPYDLENYEFINTASKIFADDIMRLSIHAGWSSYIQKKEYIHDYTIYIIKNNNEPEINSKQNEYQKEELYDYQGKVYCLEVPSHVFMMRQNNKNVWIGNCCYTDDHDVLTDKGWINIKELTKGYKVASLVNDNELQYVHPTDIQSYYHKGLMYQVDSQQVSLCVTPNHRMYVAPRTSKKYRIEMAEEVLGKMRKYKKNVEVYEPINRKNTFTLPAFEDFPEKEINLKAWCIFFGIWIAEGCTHSNPDYICFAAHKQRVKNALEQACLVLGLNIRKHIDKANDEDKRDRWCIFDKQFTAYLTPLSVGAINKYLPEWCFDLSMEMAGELINGMLLGDGHTNNSGTRIYDTSSVKLADDFQRLCLHAGFSTNIMLKYEAGHESVYKKTGQVIRQNVDAWRMSVISKQNNPLVNKTKQLDELIDFDGFVYCCTVPSGIIYVRRKSIPVWCGNSRNGNKGTIGSILPQSAMPFTEEGIIPDIIVTPVAFMGRRIIGQLFESIIGKIAAINGYEEADGTPYVSIDINSLVDQLEKLGYDGDGTEWLYNGMTGQKMKSKIFVAPVYYQRLKHIVFDKMHSRNRGPKTILVRQPPEGRARDGGGRLGEMERDSILAHGVSFFIKEKLMDTSDAFCIQVCNKCGLFAQRMIKKDTTYYPSDGDIYYCKACNNKTDIGKTIVPYAFKLMIQELLSMNVCPRLRLKAY